MLIVNFIEILEDIIFKKEWENRMGNIFGN